MRMSMKRLICYTDIEEAHNQGETYLIINDQTIVTPLAQDLIDDYEMEVRYEQEPINQEIVGECLPGVNFSKESLLELLRKVLTEGNENPSPFEYETHENGLKVIKGDTVKLSRFDTGKSTDTVYSQKLVSKSDQSTQAGIVEMKETSVDWTVENNEINYVISGSLSVRIDGKDYQAKAGDTIYIPKKSTLTWCVPERAKLFYVTCPTN